MAIRFIKTLPASEGLKAHKVLADFAGTDFSLAFVTAHGSNIYFGGELYDNMEAVAEAIAQKVDIPDTDIAGFAGRAILSCHFTASAADVFKASFPQQANENLVSQFAAGSTWVHAVTNWANAKNQGSAKQPIRVELVGEKFNTYNVIFPNSDLMEEFELRKSRGLFDAEAQALIDAGALSPIIPG